MSINNQSTGSFNNFKNNKPYFKKFNRTPRGPRKNEGIRVPEVRVVGIDGQQLGVLGTRDAIDLARKQGVDLVEIAPMARPPVCKIIDYGKYMYEEGKKQKKQKTPSSKVKEVKFRPHIDKNDYLTKLRHAESFLDDGNKVKITLEYKNRDNRTKEDAIQAVVKIAQDLNHIGSLDALPSYTGRNSTAMISPLAENKKKLKYTADDEIEVEKSEIDASATKPKEFANNLNFTSNLNTQNQKGTVV